MQANPHPYIVYIINTVNPYPKGNISLRELLERAVSAEEKYGVPERVEIL